LRYDPSQIPNNPMEYTTAMTALIAEYPVEVIEKVTDPVHGIAARLSFLPKIAQMKEALEAELEPYRKAWLAEYEKRKALPRYTPPKRTPEEIEEVRRIASSWSKHV